MLGSTAIEHKFFARSFVDAFPAASFYACPGVFNYVPFFSPNLAPAGLGLLVDVIRPARVDGWLTGEACPTQLVSDRLLPPTATALPA